MLGIEANKEKIIELLRSTNREGVEELIRFLETSTYFTCPASVRHHNNCPGGLADHSLKIYYILKNKVKMHKLDVNEDSIILVSLLHDLCKVDTYELQTKWKKDDRGKWQSYLSYASNGDYKALPHGTSSMFIAQQYIRLTEEEASAIANHMGAYGLSNTNDLGYAYKKFPLTLLLHHADAESAYIHEEEYPMDAIPGLE